MEGIREEFEERAAICEFEGRMTRQAAEAMAMDQIASKYGEAGIVVILDGLKK